MNNEKQCFICGERRENSLEQHHIVPKRFDGTDEDENIVTLCASCHAAIEKLYDRRFYEELGVEKRRGPDSCQLDNCTAVADRPLDGPLGTLWVCSRHGKKCGTNLGLYAGQCSQKRTSVVRSFYDNQIELVCDDHSVCGHSGCKSTQVYFDPKSAQPYQRCIDHFDITDDEEEARRG